MSKPRVAPAVLLLTPRGPSAICLLSSTWQSLPTLTSYWCLESYSSKSEGLGVRGNSIFAGIANTRSALTLPTGSRCRCYSVPFKSLI